MTEDCEKDQVKKHAKMKQVRFVSDNQLKKKYHQDNMSMNEAIAKNKETIKEKNRAMQEEHKRIKELAQKSIIEGIQKKVEEEKKNAAAMIESSKLLVEEMSKIDVSKETTEDMMIFVESEPPIKQETESVNMMKGWCKEMEGWTRVRSVMDSGCGRSVAPPGMCPSYPVVESAGSKAGQNFVSATEGIIPNLGEQLLNVEMDGGEAGVIVRMIARAAILETYDGRWIVIPNEDFITTRVVNYSDSGSSNRYEVPFSVSYDTDINLVPAIVAAAVAKLPEVLDKPFPPDSEQMGFGDSGIDFSLEFWVNGIDDGQHKYKSKVLFAIWNALKDAGIEIPYPHRVVEIKGDMKGLKL